jgi:tripartite-type tricarboxylate transporter receptor subunit TctC
MKGFDSRAVLLMVAEALSMTAPAAADPVADFYKGKTISVIVGAGPAGGYDLSARLVARHLPRFISGNPNVVVRNMPGASSNLAALHVFNVAARDGSVLGMFQPTFVVEKINDHSLKYEPDQFTWISRVDTSTLVGIVWHKSPVQTIADAKQKQAVLAGIAASGTAATVPWALNQMIGTKFKVALGYSSSAEAGLAIERGEVDGTGSTSWDYLETKPQWLAQKTITFLYTIALARYRVIPNIPTILELTDNEKDRKVLGLIASGSTIGRSVVGPPGIPLNRVTALQKAFDEMVKDPDFLADANARHLGVDPLSGPELQRIVAEVAGAPEDVIAKMQSVTRPPN